MRIKDVITGLVGLAARFKANASGQIAIIFAFSATLIVTGVGAGIDLSRAYAARQKLSQVAVLTCQYSARDSVVAIANNTSTTANGFATYKTTVNAFATASLASQKLSGATGGADLASAYFTATPAGTATNTATSTSPTNPYVDISVTVPTYFMRIVNIPTIPVHAKLNCHTAANSNEPDTNLITQTGFEKVPATCANGYCFILPNGTSGTQSTPTSATPAQPSYTDTTGTQWYILGYCLETDTTGVINATSPEGSHTAELDCDNGSGSGGNSSISTKVYLSPGHFELRYNYRSRVTYYNYDPVYICGTTANDVAWANDTTSFFSGSLRTNQINTYLDMATSTSIPLHTTIDKSQQLGGSNLIDMCVYSPNWVERSVKITVTTPAYYWLSFAADGANDSYGGQIDNIRLCQETCTSTAQESLDNFPSSWLSANNGGVNKVLFEDTFESPVYAPDPYTSSAHAKGGNLANSYGVTTTSTCNSSVSSPSGWPCQTAIGWAVAPYNEVMYWMQGATQGTQYISLQGWNGFSNSTDPLNRSISRYFILDPGYYNVQYNYTSLTDFGYNFVYNASCYYLATSNYSYNNAPGGNYIYTYWGLKTGRDYGSTTLYQQYMSTNAMQVYMANGQLISTPSINSTLGGAPTYTNPDGTTSSTPTLAPDNGSIFTAYSATAVNPVIDACVYSGGYTWLTRSTNIKITKPGKYWLTFSSQGDPLTGAGAGAAIDDVKLTALSSSFPTPTAPPTTFTTIPVPDPQPDSAYYGPSNAPFNGFYIVADPVTPPAANQ